MEAINRITARMNFGARRRNRSNGQSSSASSSNSSQSPSVKSRMVAPHPIPAGREDRVCPISGLFADEVVVQATAASKARLADLQADPDIQEEIRALAEAPASKQEEVKARTRKPIQFVRFNAHDGSHKSNEGTRQLVREVGFDALLRFTTAFYEKQFADVHLDQFIADHDDPHGERFALWITEKFGDGTPWTQERRTRPKKYMQFGWEKVQVAHDRSSAHFAAWHSPKRPAEKWGDHFTPEDARVWMRLHFWAARENGMFDEHPAFMEYYIRFIGHFVSVYSSKSPPFARESARWSEDPENIQRYLGAGRRMTDVLGQDLDRAIAALPAEERVYTGSRSRTHWPYEQ